jgi:hypothetical protein
MPHWAMPLYCSGASARPLKRAAREVHFDVIVELKTKRRLIHYNVISLLLCFGHPPTMMDAVSVTIVDGG